jgi:alpha-ketoglutarate-dependent taurine dioxygenase
MEIRKLKKSVGAQALNFDLSTKLSPDELARLNDALVDNVVLVIRDQRLTATQLREAIAQFGELMEDQVRRYALPQEPFVSVLSNRHLDSKGKPAQIAANATWHTDHTNLERPPKFTCLYALEIPERGGGTFVCNTRAAYARLSAAWKQRLAPLTTANVLISSARADVANPDIIQDQIERAKSPVIHPLVRTHPERDTQALWFHKTKVENVVGMSPTQSQVFLDSLLDEIITDDVTYYHQWRIGDLLMIDNRSALHKADHVFDQVQHRKLYRMLVRGDRPH